MLSYSLHVRLLGGGRSLCLHLSLILCPKYLRSAFCRIINSINCTHKLRAYEWNLSPKEKSLDKSECLPWKLLQKISQNRHWHLEQILEGKYNLKEQNSNLLEKSSEIFEFEIPKFLNFKSEKKKRIFEYLI